MGPERGVTVYLHAIREGHQHAIREGHQHAIREGNQWPSVAISGHPRQLVAIRGHQRSSGVISRHQRTVRVRDSTNRKVPQYPRRSWQVGGAPPLQPGLWRSDYRGCCCCCCCCLWHRRRRLHLRPLGGDRRRRRRRRWRWRWRRRRRRRLQPTRPQNASR